MTEEKAGGRTWVVRRHDVTLPADATVERNDRLTVTDAPFDIAQQGAELALLDVPLDSCQIARFCTRRTLHLISVQPQENV